MAIPLGETLSALDPPAFRRWLLKNHATKSEIWLVQYKKTSAKRGISYADALEEAICFGWIDSSVRRLDEERYAIRFTPRRPKSNWTEANRALAKRLEHEGRMTEAGRRALPKDP